MAAKKSLGQHFLRDESVAERIKNELVGFERIVEIGGGRGALTEKLLELKAELSVVEIDEELAGFLKKRFKGVNIINDDATGISLPDGCAVVGNLPYNSAKRIIRNIVNQKEKVKKAVFMVQKEVADSMVASPGDAQYGRFSVIVQLFFRVRRLLNVPPGAFVPPPKVLSSVVALYPLEGNLLGVDVDKKFFSFLNVLFAHPRKTVKNNIKVVKKDIKMNELLLKRPGDLTIKEMYQLFMECYHE